jgi:hypothetical protein
LYDVDERCARGAGSCQNLSMDWQWRRIKLLPGKTSSRSSSGWRLSIGRRGAQPNIARRGVSATRSVVETGASYVKRLGRR